MTTETVPVVPLDELVTKAAQALAPAPRTLLLPLNVPELRRLGDALLAVAADIADSGHHTPPAVRVQRAYHAAGMRVHLLAQAYATSAYELEKRVHTARISTLVTDAQAAAQEGCSHAFRLLRIWSQEVRRG